MLASVQTMKQCSTLATRFEINGAACTWSMAAVAGGSSGAPGGATGTSAGICRTRESYLNQVLALSLSDERL